MLDGGTGGGGQAPDIVAAVGQASVLASSTDLTRPHTVNTRDEHLNMRMECHHLDAAITEAIVFAESHNRHENVAAGDVLHDMTRSR